MAENTVYNKGNLSSQSSQLEEEDLQKLEADSMPVNTKMPKCSNFMAGGEVHVAKRTLFTNYAKLSTNTLCRTFLSFPFLTITF